MNGSLRCLNSALSAAHSRAFPNSVIPSVFLPIFLNSPNCLFVLCFPSAMEPSQNIGASEECHSSESGWTMYIGSPVDDSTDGDAATDDDGAGDDDYAIDMNNEDDSDDSMASDASSGPSHQGHPFGNGKTELFKHPNEVKFCLEGKAKKPLMAEQRRERKEVKEELVLMSQKAKGSVQSSSKVGKGIWVGKRN